jgi:hypothetical protein
MLNDINERYNLFAFIVTLVELLSARLALHDRIDRF